MQKLKNLLNFKNTQIALKIISITLISMTSIVGCIDHHSLLGTNSELEQQQNIITNPSSSRTNHVTSNYAVNPRTTNSTTIQNSINRISIADPIPQPNYNENLFLVDNNSRTTTIQEQLNQQLFNNDIRGFSNTPDYNQPYCPSPVIAEYHYALIFTIICAKLPNSFKNQIPDVIKEIMQRYNEKITDLELFVVAQRNFNADMGPIFEKSLKISPWIFPNIPNSEYKGENFWQRNYLMGIFSSNARKYLHIQGASEQGLVAQSVHLHGGTISPNNAHIPGLKNPLLANNTNHEYLLAFYSVVIDSVTHKAVITLHIIMDNRTADSFYEDFNMINNTSTINLNQFVNFIKNRDYSNAYAYANFTHDRDEIVNFLEPQSRNDETITTENNAIIETPQEVVSE